MFIAETFTSIQGEGTLVGTPSFFIRTSGCNLRCRWCDTPYTSWQPEGRRRTVAALVEAAREAELRHVVVTGGEPLLQREIGALTAALTAARHHVTVETAGTVAPRFECDLLSVSPKTASSDPDGRHLERHRSQRSATAPLRALLDAHREYQLKFVVASEADEDEIVALVEDLGVPRERVVLMAEGRTAAEVAERAGMVARMCLQRGYRYTPRLHLDLFGARRGV